jgi:hypothetical protein
MVAAKRVANLRARAHVMCGRAHARRGELAAAARVLRAALHAAANAGRSLGAVAADAHAALADVAAWTSVFSHAHVFRQVASAGCCFYSLTSPRRGDFAVD